MLEKTINATPKKKLGIGSPVFCTFPNNIGPARQQSRDLGSLFYFSGHSYYVIALRLIDYMGFAMEAKTKWKMGKGVGVHAPAPQPFVWG